MEFQLTQEMLDTIDQYIKGQLEGDKLEQFEKELEANTSLKEEMLIQKQLFETIENKNLEQGELTDEEVNEIREKQNSADYKDLSQKIKQIGQEYVQNPVQEKKPLWIRFRKFIPAAAAILTIVIISTVYLTNDNQSFDKYYYDNVDWNTELVSLVEKGDAKSEFANGETYFKSGEFSEAIQVFGSINPEDELYPYSLMYLGASHSNLNQDQQALQVFNRLTQMKEFVESSKGLWYAALIHLKLNDKEKALESLNLITEDSNNYRHSEALKLISELK